MHKPGVIGRAALLAWWLRGGERVDPRAVAPKLGTEPRAVASLLGELSRVLPIVETGKDWRAEEVLTKRWELVPPERLAADSPVGRLYADWQAAHEAERAAAKETGRLRQRLAEILERLAAARYGEMTPQEFAMANAEAELLRRTLPEAEAKVEAARQRTERLKAMFADRYQCYMRAVEERNKAAQNSTPEEVRRHEERIWALIGTRSP